ncbi:RidA/YER057c/UK114 superfamily protein [Olavius algarvensis associated proteobacterium Delta 3]|nr:RidA/YER057c/UK114 superfamily protein [Olavius algarvensis associated proteobacterium Delta 3]CAB5129156.1 RidA/YER057c/UK114 superfamily protein [Olavius algarvensis associated proteobacterium Delta 3]
MSEIKAIKTTGAPAAFGPFSQGVKTDTLVFATGQLPLDPATGEVVSDDVQEQTRQVMNNLKAVLAEAGCSMDRVLKATVFITSMDDFTKMNEVYAEYFSGTFPARSCIEVSGLAKGAKVEVEAIALLP